MDAADLRVLPLFHGLTPQQLQQLAGWSDVIDVDINHRLIRHEDFGHEFFVILSGTAEAMDGEIHLADLAPGDFFGEISLLDHDRRTAAVKATSPMRLMVMDERGFRSMMGSMPLVAERVQAKVDERREASEFSKG
ncbi:MAG TPA: cyclic nucleotide-binding domain-containing protein [Gaiellales bacterium]|nr:cyclic nucleotide-binding domain-containing protein [Gaiellales bacterium]